MKLKKGGRARGKQRARERDAGELGRLGLNEGLNIRVDNE